MQGNLGKADGEGVRSGLEEVADMLCLIRKQLLVLGERDVHGLRSFLLGQQYRVRACHNPLVVSLVACLVSAMGTTFLLSELFQRASHISQLKDMLVTNRLISMPSLLFCEVIQSFSSF